MLLHLLIGILAAIGGLVVLAILALTIAYFIVARQLSLKLQGTVEQMQALLADSIEANGEREDARGSTYDSVPPMRIQLKPLESGLWRTEPLGARVDAWLREHSFSAVGDFRVLEIDQEVLRVYLSDDRRLLAALRYQADSPQPYVEFCFDLGHGTRGGISNPPGSPIELPPEAVGKYFRGGLNDDFSLLSRMWLEAKELVDEHTVYAIDAEQIAAFFEEAHAAQMDFQLARGGVSEAEIRAAFTAQGIEPSDDDIAHIQQQWQLAIEQRLLELSHRGQRQQADGQRLLIVHDASPRSYLLHRVGELLEKFDASEPQQPTAMAVELTQLLRCFAPREAIARFRPLLPVGLRYQLVEQFKQPIEADLYSLPSN